MALVIVLTRVVIAASVEAHVASLSYDLGTTESVKQLTNIKNRGIFEKSRGKVWLFRNKYVPLHPQVRDLAQLVAHTSGGREVAGSSPVIPTREGRL